jgi:putative oxidoreductase
MSSSPIWARAPTAHTTQRSLLPLHECNALFSLTALHRERATGMLILRVVTASLMVHHGLQKTGNPQGFADNVIAIYFTFLPGDPLFWTYLAATFELAGSFCITVGLFARPAAALLAGTMVNAVAFQLMSKGLQNYPFGQPPSGPAYTFEPSLAFLAVSMRLATVGPGRFGLQTCCQPVRSPKVSPSLV